MLKGPRGGPSPIEIQPEDFDLIKQTKAVRRAHGFSPSGPHGFSALRVGATSLAGDCIPPRNQHLITLPPPALSGANFQTVHAVCSKHGRGGSWQIADFCEECNRLAEAATVVGP